MRNPIGIGRPTGGDPTLHDIRECTCRCSLESANSSAEPLMITSAKSCAEPSAMAWPPVISATLQKKSRAKR